MPEIDLHNMAPEGPVYCCRRHLDGSESLSETLFRTSLSIMSFQLKSPNGLNGKIDWLTCPTCRESTLVRQGRTCHKALWRKRRDRIGEDKSRENRDIGPAEKSGDKRDSQIRRSLNCPKSGRLVHMSSTFQMSLY